MTTARKILLNTLEYLLISVCMICALIVLGTFGAMDKGSISDEQALLQVVISGIACFGSGYKAYEIEGRLKQARRKNKWKN